MVRTDLPEFLITSIRRFLLCLPRPRDADTPRVPRRRVTKTNHLFHLNRRSGRESNPSLLNSSPRFWRLSYPSEPFCCRTLSADICFGVSLINRDDQDPRPSRPKSTQLTMLYCEKWIFWSRPGLGPNTVKRRCLTG
jgi:hypothetical protein